MNIFTDFISILLGTNEEEAKDIANTWYPRLVKLGWHLVRLMFVGIAIHCLWNYPSAGIMLVFLGWFIIESERRIGKLEQQLKIERKINREAYSTERYTRPYVEKTS